MIVSLAAAFSGIDTWIFDLDNTLYPPETGLLDQINTRMTAFIMRELGLDLEEAFDLRAAYWRQYGITLGGLVEHHGVDPAHFLADTHQIDLKGLKPDLMLHQAISVLPGRKIIHTNGSRAHANAVLRARGLVGSFEAIYAIEDKALTPKPREEAYRIVIERAGVNPTRSAMIEDTARNLEVPKGLGMKTILVTSPGGEMPPDHVDHATGDLTAFLRSAAAT